MRRPPLVAICGSMRGFSRMLQVAEELTGQGVIVLMPFVTKAEPDGSDEQKMLDRLHRQKMLLSDHCVFITISGYMGFSTLAEQAFADALGIPYEVRDFDD